MAEAVKVRLVARRRVITISGINDLTIYYGHLNINILVENDDISIFPYGDRALSVAHTHDFRRSLRHHSDNILERDSCLLDHGLYQPVRSGNASCECAAIRKFGDSDRKSTRLNSSHSSI